MPYYVYAIHTDSNYNRLYGVFGGTGQERVKSTFDVSYSSNVDLTPDRRFDP
jgi:hypothetical protein